VPVTQTSFDKRLNDWSIENESKNSAWLWVNLPYRVVGPCRLSIDNSVWEIGLWVKTLSSSVLIRLAYPFLLKIVRCLKKNSMALFFVTKCNFKHRNYTYCEWHMI
jgi:hypothetical protein